MSTKQVHLDIDIHRTILDIVCELPGVRNPSCRYGIHDCHMLKHRKATECTVQEYVKTMNIMLKRMYAN